MNKIRILFAVMLAAVLFTGCKKDDDSSTSDFTPKGVTTLNVDVVLPADIRTQWQPSIDWALANLSKAQQKQDYQVKLNLRFHDEDKENLDKLAYKLANPEAGDDTCAMPDATACRSSCPPVPVLSCSVPTPVTRMPGSLPRVTSHSVKLW